ncbi:MAG: hypothetical protein WBA44_09670 [Mesorhizobium sp.]
MKAGFSSSLVVHVLVLGFGLVALKAPAPHDVSDTEALPVSIIPIESMTELMQGDKSSKVLSEKPAPKPTEKKPSVPDARNAGSNDVDLDDVPRPEAAPRRIETSAAPKVEPQPDVAPEPVEAKPEPKPEPKVAEARPEPKPEPKPEPVAEPKPAEPKPDPIAEAINAEPTPKENTDFPQELPRPESRPTPPQQVAKAETKPVEKPAEKPAEKAAEKPAKENAAKNAKAPKQQDIESLLDEAKALVNKQKPAGGGAQRSDQTASVGSERRNTGAKLSVGEMDALRQRLASCWSIPAGVDDAELLKVSVRFRLDRSGELEARPEVIKGGGASGPARTAAESALRAVSKCAPFNLPADKYETWAEVVVNFDPSDMF